MAEDIRVLWFAEQRSDPLPLAAAPPLRAIQQLRDRGELRESLRFNPAHVVVVELNGAPTLALLQELARDWPDVGLVAFGDEAQAESAFSAGAQEVLAPRTASPELLETLLRAARRAQVAGERVARSRLDEGPLGLVGASRAMADVRELIRKVSESGATVLVRGETGTGKELVARAIHAQSRARSGPLLAVHAAALPSDLLESELFGYEKGAFTGASSSKPGRVELAQGGTLFLDEVAEISASVQAKLLRLLQEREFSRLGATKTLKTDARFVAATHRNLEQMAERGEFRQDLLYRLNVLTVWLPPLRARREDIGELAEHFLQRFGQGLGKALQLEANALAALRAGRWPGNVRELSNVLERLAVLTTDGVIREADVELELTGRGAFTTQPSHAPEASPADGATLTRPPVSSVRPLRDQLEQAERSALLKALERAEGNRTLAARLLGVGRRTLYTKLEEHGLL